MVNKVILLGYAGAGPEYRTLESGVPMARLRMATSERWIDHTNGQWKELTQWHDVVLWRDMADYAYENIDKGAMVYLEGRIRMRDGRCEIIADVLKVLKGKLYDARKSHQNSMTDRGANVAGVNKASMDNSGAESLMRSTSDSSVDNSMTNNNNESSAFSKFVDEFVGIDDELPF